MTGRLELRKFTKKKKEEINKLGRKGFPTSVAGFALGIDNMQR